MFRQSRGLAAVGGFALLATACGGLLGSSDENACAGADCSSSGGLAQAGTGGRLGSGGGAGVSGAPSGEDDCKEPSDCELVPIDCCGTCQAKASDYVALSRKAVSDYVANRPCTDRLCPECAQTGGEWVTATCVAGRCQVLDVRETELTACEASEDCYLRAGLDCCADCGGSAAFVALSKSPSARIEQLVCDAEFACDACVAIPPETLAATCVVGRCQTMRPTR